MACRWMIGKNRAWRPWLGAGIQGQLPNNSALMQKQGTNSWATCHNTKASSPQPFSSKEKASWLTQLFFFFFLFQKDKTNGAQNPALKSLHKIMHCLCALISHLGSTRGKSRARSSPKIILEPFASWRSSQGGSCLQIPFSVPRSQLRNKIHSFERMRACSSYSPPWGNMPIMRGAAGGEHSRANENLDIWLSLWWVCIIHRMGLARPMGGFLTIYD